MKSSGTHGPLSPIACLVASLAATGALAEQSLPEGGFTLTTEFRDDRGECLDGNHIDGVGTGAARMDLCEGGAGQVWQAIPAQQDGYFRLTTRLRAPFDECLEGNQIAGNLGGAAFMASCQEVSGQLWRLIPADNGYVRLTTLFREPFDECLEANDMGGVRGGAAFMVPCQNVSGQLWRAVPHTD